MKSSLAVILLIGGGLVFAQDQPSSTNEQPIAIPLKESSKLRLLYDAALRQEYEARILEEKLKAAQQAASVAFERYQSAVNSAMKELKVPDGWVVDRPVFTQFMPAQNSSKDPPTERK